MSDRSEGGIWKSEGGMRKWEGGMREWEKTDIEKLRRWEVMKSEKQHRYFFSI